MALLLTMSFTNVFAEGDDDATLSDLTVRALDSSYDEVEKLSSFNFNSENTEYEVVLSHDTAYVQISAETSDDGASTSLPSYNYFRVYSGENTEEVVVTSANGETLTYTITLKVLTESEETEYIEQYSVDSSDLRTTSIGEDTLYVSYYIPDDIDIPTGFEKDIYTVSEEDYEVLYNEKKDMYVFYLYENKELEEGGLYVFNEEYEDNGEELFYPLQNIKVKSRMYTVVSYATASSYEDDKEYLDDLTQTEIDIDGETVEAWEIAEDGDFYLLYAVNWNGEENLYCYDSVEKCLQRYDINSSTIQQLEAAGDSYTELKTKYNELVTKYNKNNSSKWKIIAALCVFCIILIFVMINLILRIKSSEPDDEESFEYDDDDTESIGGYVELNFEDKKEEKTDIDMVSIDEIDEEDAYEEEKKEDIKKEIKESVKEDVKEKDSKKKEKDDIKEDDENAVSQEDNADDDFEFID